MVVENKKQREREKNEQIPNQIRTVGRHKDGNQKFPSGQKGGGASRLQEKPPDEIGPASPQQKSGETVKEHMALVLILGGNCGVATTVRQEERKRVRVTPALAVQFQPWASPFFNYLER